MFHNEDMRNIILTVEIDHGRLTIKRYVPNVIIKSQTKTLTKLILGETIPIRLFLGGFDLTPTFREVNKKYSTRYYLSLVLIDEGNISNSFLSTPFQSMLLYLFIYTTALQYSKPTNITQDARRYFKQSEIVLYRQAPEITAGSGQQTQIQGAPPPERAQ